MRAPHAILVLLGLCVVAGGAYLLLADGAGHAPDAPDALDGGASPAADRPAARPPDPEALERGAAARAGVQGDAAPDTAPPEDATPLPDAAAAATPPVTGGAIHGRVVDAETGAPLPDARVVAYQPGRLLDVGGGEQETRASGDGFFTLSGPFPAGEVLLAAEGGRHRTRTPLPGVDTQGRDLFHVILPAAPLRRLQGRVVDPHGEALAAAAVELRARERVHCCLESDGRGCFAADDVGLLLGLDHAPEDTEILLVAWHAEFRRGFAATSIGALREPRDVEVVLEPGAVVAGRAMDAASTPLEGVVVRAWPESGARFEEVRSTRTDAGGAFRIAGLPPGRLRVESEPHVRGLSPHAPSVALDVAIGVPREDVELVYLNGLPLAGRAIAREDEHPLADRRVALFHPDRLEPIETLTDEQGRFRFPALPEGVYTLALYGRLQGAQDRPIETAEVAAGRDDVTLIADDPPADGVLVVRVVDAASGEAVAGEALVRLSFETAGGPRRIEQLLPLGPEGTLTVEGLERVEHRAEVGAAGFAPARFAASFTRLAPRVERAVFLARARTMHGVVVDRDGRPVSGARLRAFAEYESGDFETAAGTPADDAGHFTLRDAPPDATVLAVAAPGFAPVLHDLASSGGLWGDVRVVLQPGRRVEGIWRNPDGTPAAGVLLSLEGPIVTHFATAGAGGRYVFEDVEEELGAIGPSGGE